VFGGSLATGEPSVVEMGLWVHNGTAEPIREIKLQTCAFMRGIREFSAYSMSNKYVHTPGQGWIPFEDAKKETRASGRYLLGWRSGPAISDLPVLVTVSEQEDRLVGMTWHEHTLSLIGNPGHPCMHADPFFPDLEPGQNARIKGELLFHEGSLTSFEEWFRQRNVGQPSPAGDVPKAAPEE
jgi:hypothetical protein